MEFLVTMTTNVPEGTSEAAVDEVRSRESDHSRELAAQGHLLRLWRPPLAPGEWRSLGLFDADDPAALEALLVSMPLRVWRSDDVVALSSDANDPGRQTDQGGRTQAEGSEFFTTFTITVPAGTASDVVGEVYAREAVRARELAGQGRLVRLWELPGEGRSLGLWRAGDPDEVGTILASLPVQPWALVETVQLSPHPSDPGLTHS
jgi:muconolactone delta-isomerase